MRKFIITAILAASFLVPAAAQASLGGELKAGNKAEQKLQNRYKRYSVYALCDTQGSRYWCTVGGSRGDCFVSGHAWVKGNRVSLVGVNRTCL
jgi:hypothetical protein